MASTLLSVVIFALAAATAAQQSPEPLLAEILDNLGFNELARGVQSLHQSLPYPVTVFAPSDDLLRRSRDFSVLLPDVYLAPGLHSAADLARLPYGSKLDLQRGRCLTVTSIPAAAGSKIFVDGVEITRPDLFNDGRIAIHGLRNFIPPFYRLSCGDDPLSKMLREAISVLHHGGYKMLAAEVDVVKRDLVLSHNTSYMTLFGFDDQSILAGGGERYMSDAPFYIVPDHRLTLADLVRLPERTVLPTLGDGQRLVVTRSGAARAELLQINGMSIKAPDVVCNAKIAVHGITEPFSADYHQGFRLFSGFVRVIYAIVMVTLAKSVVLKLANVRRRPRGHGRGRRRRRD